MDQAKIEQAIRMLLEAIGEDPQREGLIKTPSRIGRAYEELFSGYLQERELQTLLTTFEKEKYDQMVLVKNIEFYSHCEHHMLPFFGKCHVAYIPKDRVIGVSKIPRIVDIFARRLQLQERLTYQIAEALDTSLQPKGVAIVVKARHLCMSARGVKLGSTEMVTSDVRGVFRDKIEARAEFLQLLEV